MVAEAETEQAPGTWVEVESCLKSSVPSSPAQPLPVLLHTNVLGYVGTPACCLLLSLGAFCFTFLPRD